MRSCRLCLKPDVSDTMINLFDEVDLIVDLNYLANISVKNNFEKIFLLLIVDDH
jgi:hypothetical protein